MRSSASVVIVGAGIVGCSAAHFLTRLGWRDVVVLEQGPLFQAGGSTSHAPGLVFQTNGSKTMTALAKETVNTYAGLELDGEPCYYPVGSLEVATTPERWADLHRKLGWARSWGIAAELITPTEAKERIPLLNADRILGAYAVPSDGIAKAVRAAEALARSATANGAEFHARTPVTGIEITDGRVQAVQTPQGGIATDRVLLCGGIWGPKLGRLAGVPIPLVPVQHQFAWTTPVPELTGETREVVHPILRHQDRDMYFRQRGDSYGVGSYAHEPLLVDADEIRPHAGSDDMPASLPFTTSTFDAAWDDGVDLLPALARTEIAEAVNGMFSFTPDGFPLLGEAAHVRGCWVAEAIWITHGAGAGRAIAEWMTHGHPVLDLHECDLNRFEPFAQTRAYVRARGAQQYREVYDVIHPLEPLKDPRPLRRSPFYERQRELGAVFFEGRGWEQPRWYAANKDLLVEYRERVPRREGWAGRFWSPVAGAEHLATRERVALYDMTTLPKLEVRGPGALALLDRLTTNRVDRPVGSVTYALMVDEDGGILSDVTVARLEQDRFQIGCNGPLDLAWLRKHLPDDGSVQVRDLASELCCLGLWGPRARDLAQSLSPTDLGNAAFPYYTAQPIEIGEVPVLAMRVSYVGELGWELYAPAELGGRLWDLLWEAGQSFGIIAGGRAAFDALRIEKGYRLWGADMHSEYDPYEAGLSFAVRLGKGDFLGRAALERKKERGPSRRLCCLTVDDGTIVLGKEPIHAAGRVAGYVTSAAYGFSLGRSIAYGYLPADFAAPGTQVEIEYFGELHPATVVDDPLWDSEGKRLRA